MEELFLQASSSYKLVRSCAVSQCMHVWHDELMLNVLPGCEVSQVQAALCKAWRTMHL